MKVSSFCDVNGSNILLKYAAKKYLFYLGVGVGVERFGPLALPVEIAKVQRPSGHGVRRAGHSHNPHVGRGLGGRLAEEGQEAAHEGVVADKVDAHVQLEAVLGPPRLVRVRRQEAAALNEMKQLVFRGS